MVAQDIIVVSDIGETWSPKMEPPKSAPATSGTSMPMFIAIGSAMTDIIAIVPIEVPVANDSIIDMMKVSSGRSSGTSALMNIDER